MRPKPWLDSLLCALFTLALALTPPTNAWAAPKYKVLHAFTGGKDGAGLWGSLTLDGKGNVYGATALDTIFELSPRPGGKWRFQVLCTLNEGSFANGGMIFDSAGNLYGTTQVGGPYGDGVVFELSPGARGWTETVLYDSPPGVPAGAPWDGPIMDKAGNLYGTGGSAFKLSPGSKGWNLTILHEFTCKNGDGCAPYAGPIMDSAGNLYGTTAYGGGSTRCDAGCGTVYQLAPTPGGKWKETILHRFQARWDGAPPGLGALVLDGAGNLYGTADGGNTGYGVIFRLSPGSDGHWKETVLYNITGGANGNHPSAGVVMDKAGNLYGTTIAGGSGCDCGVVYKLAPGKNGKWTYTVLHAFVGSDGAQPDANLILDSKGNLYGTTATGGAGGYGVAFEITP